MERKGGSMLPSKSSEVLALIGMRLISAFDVLVNDNFNDPFLNKLKERFCAHALGGRCFL